MCWTPCICLIMDHVSRKSNLASTGINAAEMMTKNDSSFYFNKDENNYGIYRVFIKQIPIVVYELYIEESFSFKYVIHLYKYTANDISI